MYHSINFFSSFLNRAYCYYYFFRIITYHGIAHTNWFAASRLWFSKHSPLSHTPPPANTAATGTNTAIDIGSVPMFTNSTRNVTVESSTSSESAMDTPNPHIESSSSSSSSVILTNNNFRNQNLQNRNRRNHHESVTYPPPSQRTSAHFVSAAGSAETSDIDSNETGIVQDLDNTGEETNTLTTTTEGWICSACTYHCASEDKVCSMCGSDRP